MSEWKFQSRKLTRKTRLFTITLLNVERGWMVWEPFPLYHACLDQRWDTIKEAAQAVDKAYEELLTKELEELTGQRVSLVYL